MSNDAWLLVALWIVSTAIIILLGLRRISPERKALRVLFSVLAAPIAGLIVASVLLYFGTHGQR